MRGASRTALYVVAMAAALSLCGTAKADPILESVNVNYLDLAYSRLTLQTPFGPVDIGILTIKGDADIVVEYDTGQVTIPDGNFLLTTYLAADESAAGLAGGVFEDGDFLLRDADNNDLLLADIVTMRLDEVLDGSGLLAGGGGFTITGGSMTWPEEYGYLINLNFHLAPKNIDDFGSSFVGIAKVVTLEPSSRPGGDIPEPGTMTLLGVGIAAGAAWMRRRRKR